MIKGIGKILASIAYGIVGGIQLLFGKNKTKW